MLSKNFFSLFTPLVLQALYLPQPYSGDAVVPDDKDYYTYRVPRHNSELIFTQENRAFADQTLQRESEIHKLYEQKFDWKLDERLYVGLISDNNQVANGFSTQFPNNRQINYLGGAMSVDYFCSTSWLETLLYHETAHNYQANVKASGVSQTLHTIFGNASIFLPVTTTIPNLVVNSFMLEGNAVLNESWHGNGGRLYSGRFLAQTTLQAKGDNLKPEYLYNARVAFPYGERAYIQGGFYNLYMAEHYGLREINHFFKSSSEHWLWPFFTNESMEDAVGVDFERSLALFAQEQKELASHLVLAQGKKIASSQYFYPLNASQERIFFISNESGVRAPELIVLDKKSKELSRDRESWIEGKVFLIDDVYYTLASAKTSPTKIEQGLYSKNAFLKKGSGAKVIQAYLSDGEALYFDLASSFSQPQLYKGDTFYGQVNSSVITDAQDNIYYFKQEKKRRTLYKNRQALFSYEGFYGVISDVDSKGRVYFVANSEYGSTLYRYNGRDIERVSDADNIIEAKLLNDEEILLAAVGESEYYYLLNKIDINSSFRSSFKPFDRILFFEKRAYYGRGEQEKSLAHQVDLNSRYSSLLAMHYSGTDVSFGMSYDSQLTGSININFADPLSMNGANIFLTRDESHISIAGAGYSSSQYLLGYTLSAYGVVENDGQEDIREYGFIVNATLPLYEAGYYRASLNLDYFEDYDALERKPLSLSARLSYYEQYGVSFYANALHDVRLYLVKERSDFIYGGYYRMNHDLPAEFYIGAELKYSATDAPKETEQRGVKISNSLYSQDRDPSIITMPNIASAQYAKRIAYGEVNLAKVFNLSSYFFTFPLSLQRESLYAKYRYYDILDFQDVKHRADEFTTGVTFATVFFNSLESPLSFEYIYNDADFILEKEKFRFIFDFNF